MKLLTISNLFPRPDQPTRGMFNAQLFAELAKRVSLENICLVPEWRVWRWPSIRQWRDPGADTRGFSTTYVPVFYLPVVGRGWSHWVYRWMQREIKTAMQRADRVLALWIYPDGAAVAETARQAEKPIWLMALGSDTFHLKHQGPRRAILDACTYAEGVICVADILAERLKDAGVEQTKLHGVPNGVDTKLFCPRSAAAAREELVKQGMQPPNSFVLFIGNLVAVKGSDILVKAFGRLLGDRVSVCRCDGVTESSSKRPIRRKTERPIHLSGGLSLVIVGDGPMRGKLESLAREFDIANRVIFVGARPHEEIPLWMNAAVCLCLPSRSEGMPNAVLEAMACGTPVVATDVGACREMLREDFASLIVSPEDSDALANAILEVVSRKDLNGDGKKSLGIRSWGDMAEDVLGQLKDEGRKGGRGI